MNPSLLQHLLIDSAAKFSGETAIVDGEKCISYGELDKKSSVVASSLSGIGVLPKKNIAVFLDKSIEAIICFFGILKNGCCYVPIDVNATPVNRLLSIIDAGQIEYIVTSLRFLSKETLLRFSQDEINVIKSRRLIFVDGLNDGGPIFRQPHYLEGYDFYYLGASAAVFDDKIYPSTIDQDLAYILYTSGSTGVPKGVMISHINALTFINWALSYFNPRHGMRFACHASLSFDLTVFDIYVSIASGGTLVLVPQVVGKSPKHLAKWISENAINCWYSVPSVWVAMLANAKVDFSSLNTLEWVLFAGDVFPAKFLKRLMALMPTANYVNLYGPTETNVCTYYKVCSISDISEKAVPIGSACGNTEIVVLNKKMQPAEPGEEGELMVFGSSVSPGYFRNPEATKNAFVESPLPHHSKRLLYKTGDIVIGNENGYYEYVGRSDFMVKISGYRVELQEVEAVLYRFPNTIRAVALAYYCAEQGSNKLGALVEMSRTQSADSHTFNSVIDLKKAISKNIPPYMVPEIIFEVDRIPENSNGKIDRSKSATLFKELISTF